MFNFEGTQFRYEPYPIGLVKQVFDPKLYNELVLAFPPIKLFQYKPALGHKYSLSEVNNSKAYWGFVSDSPLWSEFVKYVKSDSFMQEVFEVLVGHNIDLGISQQKSQIFKRLRGWASDLKSGRLPRREPVVSARFEFSALPADKGHIRPHTDAPQKIITLVVSMVTEGDWNAAFGGGTEVVFPKDRTRSFNFKNRYLDFEEVETLSTFEFNPNQCVIFVKTFNSWHAVRPMTGNREDLFRRTLTINIELSP